MADLHQKDRDALSESEFAVPGKRKLPMHDQTHVKLAWDMVDRTEGLSPEERSEARRRIVRKAHELGVDTSGWSKGVKGAEELDIQAMSLDVPVTPGHPNKRKFRGILTRIDEPSDAAPGGSGGRRVVLTKAAAEAALETLVGMAIDCAPNLSEHDEQRKIGLITQAEVVGNAVEIAGYFYAKDFPHEMKQIDAQKSSLGFSFELTPTQYAIEGDLFRVDQCVFTGAALLYKDKAAYHSTSLAAAIAKVSEMEIKDLSDQVGAIAAGLQSLQQLVEQKLTAQGPMSAARECMAAVEPHAKAIDDRADAMQAAGIGMHPTNGHVVHLRRIASHLRAAAAQGQIPHVYTDHDWPFRASQAVPPIPAVFQQGLPATLAPAPQPAPAAPAVAPELTDALKAMTTALGEIKADIATTNNKVADVTTQVADMKATARDQSPPPARQTISSEVNRLLSRFGLSATDENGNELDEARLNTALKAAQLTPEQRLQIKVGMERHRQGLSN